MPRALKYTLMVVVAIYILRNPQIAAASISDVLNALFTVADETTKPKA